VETSSLACGVPAAELLPVEELAECTEAVLRREGGTLLNPLW
jgi:hypothetical protein